MKGVFMGIDYMRVAVIECLRFTVWTRPSAFHTRIRQSPTEDCEDNIDEKQNVLVYIKVVVYNRALSNE